MADSICKPSKYTDQSAKLAAKAVAFMEGRAFVIPEDVRAVANDGMNHRLGLSYEAEAENLTAKDIVAKIVAKVAIP